MSRSPVLEYWSSAVNPLRRILPSRQQIPILATTIVWLTLYTIASIRYDNFFSWGVFQGFFSENASLGIVAIGMTFVILSGGIDLSVGAVVGLTGILIGVLVNKAGVHPLVAMTIALAAGSLLGAAQGAIAVFFALPPFLVTLAGLFLARGLALVISQESIGIDHPLYNAISDFSFDYFPVPAIVFLATLLVGMYTAHFTRFGRAVYAIGGNEQSALLMGLPVNRTKILIYTLSGFCSALAGIVSTIRMQSGDATRGGGLELDAIAAVVIGGTLLSGGVGYVFGTLVGVLIYAIIQTAINFEGTLSSWYTKIAIGALLLAFILLQKLVQSRAARSSAH
jgi:simple sugar transport system permease protein